MDLDARQGGQQALEALEEVEGEAAVGEPARVEGAAFGVKEVADVAGAGEGELADPHENGALVGVWREGVAAVPLDAV